MVFIKHVCLLHLTVFAYCLESSSNQKNLILVKIKVNAVIKIQKSAWARLACRKDCFQ